MDISISAIGTATPKYTRTQVDTLDLVANSLNLNPAEKRFMKSVYRATGIEHRYSVLSDYCKSPGEFDFLPNTAEAAFPSTAVRMKIYQEHALPLALAAIKNAFDQMPDFDKKTITHLVTISCTGMYAPGIDIEIVKQLNLNPSTKRTCINFMGCYGAFNGLKLAESICKADSHAKVLLVSVELCSIHIQKSSNMDNIIANAIFSDGAACVLIESKPSQSKYLTLSAFHCDLLPNSSKEMAWTIADQGFDIVLSNYVPHAIQSGIASFTQNLLDQYKISSEQIDFYAIHPGGIKILQACETALNITEHDNRFAYQVLREFGNMSSATVLFLLKKILDSITHLEHNKNILSCAFGPGLTLESMLLRTHYMRA